MPLLRYLPTRVTDASAPLCEADLTGFLGLALRELRESVDQVREYSNLLETYLVADESSRIELRNIAREIRAQAELVGQLIDTTFQIEAF